MRILITKKSKEYLFNLLKERHGARSYKELASQLKIPFKTLQDWLYEELRYFPSKIVPPEIFDNLEILDKQKDNWGMIEGGKKTYKIILKKYGLQEIRKRQTKGGKKSKRKNQPFTLDITNPLFLEFYGILLGDGWIGKYIYKEKINFLIGISGHLKLDRDFLIYCQMNIQELFKRKAYLKEKPKYNALEINFSHKSFLEELNRELGFPIGKKINLRISKKIASQGYNRLKHVIRGIFDTDGSFYLDKTPSGKAYPCISIEMKAPILIGQVYECLISEGFKVNFQQRNFGKCRITLKGRRQLDKWMKEIGSSNPKHLNKIKTLVTQQDNTAPS